MSRKNKNRNQTSQRPSFHSGPAPAPLVQAPEVPVNAPRREPTPAEQVAAVEEAALRSATEADLEAAASAPLLAEESFPELLKRTQMALSLLEAQQKRLREEQGKLDSLRESLQQQDAGIQAAKESADLRSGELAQCARELDARKAALEKEEEEYRRAADDLLKQEASMRRRELNAEAGFSAERRESLQLLDKEAADLRVELSSARQRRCQEEAEHHARLTQANESWARERATKEQEFQAGLQQQHEEFEGKLAQQAAHQEARLATAQRELQAEQDALLAERTKLSREAKQLKERETILREDQGDLELLVQQRAAVELERGAGERAALEQRLQAARTDRDRLAGEILRREQADLHFGSQTPDEILRSLEELRNDRDKLRNELSRRPDEQARIRLQELEASAEEQRIERYRLQQENLELRRKLSQFEISVTELESLRDHRDALKARASLAHQQIAELRSDIEKRINSASERSSFPACQQMDEDPVLQSPILLAERKINLADFAAELRQRMAYSPETEKRLFYAERDVRCFLGGLAMSKLLLLQGVSGTGKTSLPIAFARAIGAEWKLVPVQAGWRDRQDLIGHYNEFDHRFHETEFLKALYRAQSPRCQDRPFMLLLDEMNLSHPEQYGADLLSALEQEDAYQKFHLRPAAMPGAPKLLVDGCVLRLPTNVWFIGTANHDETTRDFADKTYDRAHVMELPRHRDSFADAKLSPTEPVGLAALQSAFRRAQQQHEAEALRTYKFIDERLTAPLDQNFRIGWGNRLERQLCDFVPVVISAGGSLGEAADHIVASKLLRRLRDRHDTRREDVKNLRDTLTDAWPTLVGKGKELPPRSLAILDKELRRLGAEAPDGP